MEKTKFITTPIYYSNGRPHIGHAHTSVVGDILKRNSKLQGYNVFYTTGVDEHGQKNQKAIEESGVSAKEYLDDISNSFKGLFDKINIDYDFYVRTSSEHHKEAVAHFLQETYDRGLIVKKEYEGLYCVGCEMFKTEEDLDEKGRCKDHLTPPVITKEVNYFFKLSEYQDWLIDYINTHPEWIVPEQYRKEVLNMLQQPLPDLCISRPKSRIWLGIDLPFDHDYVTYVWFDALINYISSIGYPEDPQKVATFWQNSSHLMAKDIVKTHCIYWPIMLKAIGMQPPTRCYVHGYWTGEGGIKMSKSIGNVVDPYEMVEEFGVDGFRFFLARNMATKEAPMSRNLILSTYNSDLANILGNGFYRTLKVLGKKNGGIIPATVNYRAEDLAFINENVQRVNNFYKQDLDIFSAFEQCATVVEIGRSVNGFIDTNAPWKLANDPEQEDAFYSVIMACLESIRLMYELAWAVIPTTASQALNVLNVNIPSKNYVAVPKAIPAGQIKDFVPLFQRIEDKK